MSYSKSFNRPQSFDNRVVFIDGFSGSGKSMIAPIVSSLQSAELWKLDHVFEYSLKLYSMGGMTLEAAETLIRIYIDIDTYNLRVGRDINFRESDDSSAQKNQLDERYIDRSKGPEGNVVTEMINLERPINIFMSHNIYSISAPLFNCLGDRLELFIIPVRHPYWLIDNWVKNDWSARIGKDPRELSLTYNHNGRVYPHYARGWEDRYDECSTYERAIFMLSINGLKPNELGEDIFSSSHIGKMMFIPFENFATDPENYIDNICARLHSSRSDLTSKIMKSMNVPRKLPKNYLDKQKIYISSLFKNDNVSKEYLDIFEECVYLYESSYME